MKSAKKVASIVCLVGTGLTLLSPVTAQASQHTPLDFGTSAVDQPLTRPQAEATGKFYTRNGALYGPDGVQFIPQGVNTAAWGTLGQWDSATMTVKGKSAQVQEWGFNTLRLNVVTTDEYDWSPIKSQYIGYEKTMSEIDVIVKEYTSKGIVILLDVHDGVVHKDPVRQEDLRSQMDRFYRDAAARYKDNPYVWFGLPNEPDVINDAWVSMNDRFLGVVRAAGADNIVSVNVPTWGQDLGPNDNQPTAKRSYDPTMMPVLQKKAYSVTGGGTLQGNLITEQHNYGGLCVSPQFTTPEQMAGYIQKVAAGDGTPNSGTPTFFGEFSYDIRNNKPIDPPNPKDVWGGTDWKGTGTWQCSYDTNKRGSNNTLNAATALGAGLTFWHGNHADGRSLKNDINMRFWEGVAPGANLSEQGKHLWNLLHPAQVSGEATAINASTAQFTINATDSLSYPGETFSGGLARADFYLNDTKVATQSFDSWATEGQLTQTFNNLAPGDYTLRAVVYDTAGNPTIFEQSVTQQLTTVTPQAPAVEDLPGFADDTITPANTEGVDYKVAIDENTGDYRVEATAQEGYEIANGAQTVWTGNLFSVVSLENPIVVDKDGHQQDSVQAPSTVGIDYSLSYDQATGVWSLKGSPQAGYRLEGPSELTGALSVESVVVPEPEITVEPEPTDTEEPTVEPTVEPEPTATTPPVIAPQPTATTPPVAAPDLTTTPTPTVTASPMTPEPTVTAEPTPTVTPDPTATAPEGTAQPSASPQEEGPTEAESPTTTPKEATVTTKPSATTPATEEVDPVAVGDDLVTPALVRGGTPAPGASGDGAESDRAPTFATSGASGDDTGAAEKSDAPRVEAGDVASRGVMHTFLALGGALLLAGVTLLARRKRPV